MERAPFHMQGLDSLGPEIERTFQPLSFAKCRGNIIPGYMPSILLWLPLSLDKRDRDRSGMKKRLLFPTQRGAAWRLITFCAGGKVCPTPAWRWRAAGKTSGRSESGRMR